MIKQSPAWPDNYARDLTADHDRHNLEKIEQARQSGRINDEAAEYLNLLYSNGMDWLREVFYFLGRCFGAPKAPVMKYEYETDSGIDAPMCISDINPLSPYIVQHRLDADPMRNQFFTSGAGHQIDLSVSSIVTVLVAAQKHVERALDKISGKYYQDYINDVANTVYNVIANHEREASGRAIADKVREQFNTCYITSASETVLAMIGRGHEKIAVDLVRALDKIQKPHLRLQDVWRVKCLFDLVPQARTFIERVQEMMPERILSVKDTFYNMENPRNYRDAKLIINIGTPTQIVPMEIICQVRTFFEFERRTHGQYEKIRKKGAKNTGAAERDEIGMHERGVREYNLMVCDCLETLFERVGWNILYSQHNNVTMFEGFPKECTLYYPQKILDTIMNKLDNAVENEVLHITSITTNLTRTQECEIFRFMARFILVSAMPYMKRDWDVPSDTISGRLFNFVMTEVQRYYKKKPAIS